MKILYASSEVAPYAASGGLGDVLGSLPQAIKDKDCTHDISVILPLYNNIKEEYSSSLLHEADISFNLSWRRTGATVYKLNKSGITYYFVENNYYFNRNDLYGEYDDIERFVFFSLAILEFVKQLDVLPDILHANDWQTAMAVVYLKTIYKDDPRLSCVKSVYTVHNIEHQGKCDPYILGDVFGLDNSYLSLMTYRGALNPMRAAMLLSDKVTTVSPNYACELQHDYFAYGLSDTVKSISNKLVGILNGIDYTAFSPACSEIDYKYSKRTVRAGKAKNKAALRQSLSLDGDNERPLIVMISRLADQKGIDLLLHIIDELLMEDIDLVILGTGKREYEELLSDKAQRYSNFKFIPRFNRALSKKLYASGDIFLMPSKSEPCGLAQMIACAYGTVPIVRSVGGLCDTIIPYGNEYSNGFRFDNYNAHELLFAIKRALEVYGNTEEWHALRKRCINTDFSWSRSAENYLALYKDLTSE